MRGRRASALVWASTVLMSAAAAVFLVLGPGRPLPDDLFGGVAGAAFLMLSLTYGTVGAVIAVRLPGHRIGRLFSLIGLLSALNMLTYSYAEYGLYAREMPLAEAACVVWSTLEVVAPLLALSILLLPDGRLPSRRWWPMAALSLLAIPVLLGSRLLASGPMQDPFAVVTNPLGVPGTREAMTALDMVGWGLTWLALMLGVIAVRTRLRRSHGVERQQLKWVLSVTAAVGVVVVLVIGDLVRLARGPSPGADGGARRRLRGDPGGRGHRDPALPALRHRRRHQPRARLRRPDGAAGDDLRGRHAAAGNGPRERVGARDGRGDARGGGRVPSPACAPAGRGRPPVQPRALRRGAAGRVVPGGRAGGPRPARGRAGGAARGARRPTARAALPAARERALRRRPRCARDPGSPRPAPAHADRPGRDADRRGPPRPVDAGAAGSPAARGGGRGTGDRDRAPARRAPPPALHDGAQQRLVAIGLALRHAQHELAGGGPVDRAGETLEAALAETAVAIRELRELAHGLRPSQLDAGLGPALEDLARRVPVPVAVDATLERFPVDVEAAVYFIACEALTNAAKHAQASKIELSARRRNGSLVVCVTDDGVGGASPLRGSGLAGLSDRVGAHGGTLRIQSERGAGTRLTAELPCES